MQSKTDPDSVFTKHEKMIGKGSFGKVFKGIDNRTNEVVAIKIIDLEDTEDDIDEIQQEIKVLSQCDSVFVTKYYGSYLKGVKLWIIMEYLGGGSALDLMKAGAFDENHICIILREVLKGLEYLHSEGKLHRDIKAANILLSEHGEVKIADFGVGMFKEPAINNSMFLGIYYASEMLLFSAGQLTETISKRNTFVEVIQQASYDTQADIWSLGITGIELAEGQPPHSNMKPVKVLFHIPKNPPPTISPHRYTKFFKDFVDSCLQKLPENRPTAKELLKFPFIKRARRNIYLIELVERYQKWRFEKDSDSDSDSDGEDTLSKTITELEEGWINTVEKRADIDIMMENNNYLIRPNLNGRRNSNFIREKFSKNLMGENFVNTILMPVINDMKTNVGSDSQKLEALNDLRRAFESAQISNPRFTDVFQKEVLLKLKG